MALIYFCSFVGCAFFSLGLTSLVRDVAVRFGLLWAPESSRHLHERPVPRLGGVAIYLTIVSAFVALVIATQALGIPTGVTISRLVKILLPATIIFALGLYDDFRGANAWLKFSVQTVAALLLYANGFHFHRIWFFGNQQLMTMVDLPLTVLWIVGIANAFNLIDGLDGLAAGTALLSTATVFVVSVTLHNSFGALQTALLAGAILGFLRYNFAPASIFLGDSGSLLIGFLLAAVGLATSEKAPTAVAVLVPIIAFGLPVLDVVLAVIRRFLRERPLFDADKEHIHHKLVTRGFSQRDAVLVLYAVSAGFGSFSLLLLYSTRIVALFVAGILVPVVIVGIRQLRYHEAAEIERLLWRMLGHRRVIANNIRLRQAIDALVQCRSLDQIASQLEASMRPIGFCGISFYLSSAFEDIHTELMKHTEEEDGGLEYFWEEKDVVPSSSSLKVALMTEDGFNCGYFSAFWSTTRSGLNADLNLLTSDLSQAVASALMQIWQKSEDETRSMQSLEGKVARAQAVGL